MGKLRPKVAAAGIAHAVWFREDLEARNQDTTTFLLAGGTLRGENKL